MYLTVMHFVIYTCLHFVSQRHLLVHLFVGGQDPHSTNKKQILLVPWTILSTAVTLKAAKNCTILHLLLNILNLNKRFLFTDGHSPLWMMSSINKL